MIDAFGEAPDLGEKPGFARSAVKETGRPPQQPGGLLKPYLYGYLHQVRSSRRLEGERQKNI